MASPLGASIYRRNTGAWSSAAGRRVDVATGWARALLATGLVRAPWSADRLNGENGTLVHKFSRFHAGCALSPVTLPFGVGIRQFQYQHRRWDMRIQLLIAAAAVAGGALVIAPAVVASGPTTFLAGCGHGYYQNSDGQCIPDPSSGLPPNGAPGLVGSGGPPPGATAQCRDGDYSFSTHHTGTCSGHGGVSQWLTN